MTSYGKLTTSKFGGHLLPLISPPLLTSLVASFNGSSYLTIPYNATTQNIGTIPFIIEAWVYPTSSASMAIIGNYDSSGYGPFQLGKNSSNRLYFSFYQGGSGYLSFAGTSTTVTPNQWNHVAVQLRYEGGAIGYFYLSVNGVRDDNVYGILFPNITYGGIPGGGTRPLLVGGTGGSNNFVGFMYGLRMILNYALYINYPFTPSRSIGLTGTASTNVAVLPDVPFSRALSIKFGGQLNASVLALGTTDFTIEFWVKAFPGIGDSNGSMLCSIYYGGNSNMRIIIYNKQTAPSTITVQIGDLSNAPVDVITSNTIVNLSYVWRHVALVRISGVFSLYLDGVQSGNTFSGSRDFSQTMGLTLGYSPLANVNYDNFVSNFRIISGVGIYIGNFSPPTYNLEKIQTSGINVVATTLSSQTKLLILPSSINLAQVGTVISVTGSVTMTVATSGTIPYISTNTYYGTFNGTSQYLTSTATNWLSSSDVTVEAWINLSAYSTGYLGSYTVNIASTAIGSSPGWVLYIEGTASSYASIRLGYWLTGGIFTGANATYNFSLNTWYHVAVVRIGLAHSFYVNGVFIATQSTTGTSDYTVLNIGRWDNTSNSGFFPGKISNFRIVNGAIYTTGFTPSGPLTYTTNTNMLALQKSTSDNSATIVDSSDYNQSLTLVPNYFATPIVLLMFISNSTNDQSYFKNTIISTGTVSIVSRSFSTNAPTTSQNYIVVPYAAVTSGTPYTIIDHSAIAIPGNITGKTLNSTSGQIAITGLTPNTTYSVYLSANTKAGTSFLTAPELTVTTLSGTQTVASPPTDIVATLYNYGDVSASISFTAPSYTGTSAISSYTVTSNPGSITATGSSSPIIVTGLSNNTAYYFFVYATNSSGAGGSSSSSNLLTTGITGAPTAPTNIVATSTVYQRISVAFSVPAYTGSSAITSYTATAYPDGATASSSSSPITFNGLSEGKIYTVTVKATNAQGSSLASVESNAVNPARTVSDPATISSYTFTNLNTVSISFTAPIYTGGSSIISYTAISSPGSLTNTVTQSGSGSITITGLSTNTSYTFYLYATNYTGNSSNASVTISTITGQETITTTGLSTWMVPAGVSLISVCVKGAGGNGGANFGGGGGGGGLAYTNDYTVSQGTEYYLQVGVGSGTNDNEGTGASWFISNEFLYATAGYAGIEGVGATAGGGGGSAGYSENGGTGANANGTVFYSGGKGGYGGGFAGILDEGTVGGTGGRGSSALIGSAAAPVVTGGAAAGGSGSSMTPQGGGGVGYTGESTVDSNGNVTTPGYADTSGYGLVSNNGGSGGNSATDQDGGVYGGGGAGSSGAGGTGGKGFVRIIWGPSRRFPSSYTGNL
jgi:hypothetical protein